MNSFRHFNDFTFNSVHIDLHYERFIPHGLCRFIPCGTTPAFLLLSHFG